MYKFFLTIGTTPSSLCPLEVIVNMRVRTYGVVKASLGRCLVLNLDGVEAYSLDHFFLGSDFSQLESLLISYKYGTSNEPVSFRKRSLFDVFKSEMGTSTWATQLYYV